MKSVLYFLCFYRFQPAFGGHFFVAETPYRRRNGNVASIGKEYPFPYFCPPCRSEIACWEVSQTLYENGKERKTMNGRKRTVQVKFYVTEEERKLIEENEIGRQLADAVTKGQHEYVLTTHIDKGHIHNHIIFCAVNFVDHHKYVSNKRTYYGIRNMSDKLCRDNGLCLKNRKRHLFTQKQPSSASKILVIRKYSLRFSP